jgi:hypothetical protein
VSGQSGAWQKSPVGVRESGSLLAHPTGFLVTGEGRAVASMAVSSPTCSLVIGVIWVQPTRECSGEMVVEGEGSVGEPSMLLPGRSRAAAM